MNKYLYEKALGYYTSNADQVVDDILDNNDWSNVILWEPFETWSVEDVKELVDNLYEDFLRLTKIYTNKTLPTKEDIIQISKDLQTTLTDSIIDYVLEYYEESIQKDPTADRDLIVENLIREYIFMTSKK